MYVGFIFVLYREGLSGWWLGLIGLVIALFIGTLTIGSYWSIMGLVGVLVICSALMGPGKEFWRRLGLGTLVVGLMALVPWLWGMLTGAAQEQTWLQNLVLKIKPVYLLVGVMIVLMPFILWHAYRQRDNFLYVVVAAFLFGMALVFSTDYIFQNVLQPHQRSRIEVLLGLKEDLAGVGYNVNQSKIAIGSGGLFGKGYLHGTQTTFGFVPEQSTDFIFCTVGEEWGFLGCLVVILLYVFLIVRLIMDSERCRSPFTRIYGYCVASCVFMHLFINIGMTIGLMPVIGIPLPLLSYGGSSLWAFTILIFIFLALYRDEKKYF